MKNQSKSNTKKKTDVEQFLDHEVQPGITVKKLMENEELRSIMLRMIKSELSVSKK